MATPLRLTGERGAPQGSVCQPIFQGDVRRVGHGPRGRAAQRPRSPHACGGPAGRCAAAVNATQFATMLNTAQVAPIANVAGAGRLARREDGRARPGRGRRRRAAARLERLAAHRPVPRRDPGRPGPRPVVRVLHLVGREGGRRPARQLRPGLRPRRRRLRLGAERRQGQPDRQRPPPQPGDLIVWDEHIGIVESVAADGSIRTIEGNSSDQVARRTYGKDGGGASASSACPDRRSRRSLRARLYRSRP